MLLPPASSPASSAKIAQEKSRRAPAASRAAPAHAMTNSLVQKKPQAHAHGAAPQESDRT